MTNQRLPSSAELRDDSRRRVAELEDAIREWRDAKEAQGPLCDFRAEREADERAWRAEEHLLALVAPRPVRRPKPTAAEELRACQESAAAELLRAGATKWEVADE